MNECNFETKTFGGFDKQQVLDYIAGLIAEQKEALAEKDRQIGDLHEVIANLEMQASKANAAMQESAALLASQGKAAEESEAKQAELSERIAAKEQEIAALSSKLQETETLLNEEKKENLLWQEKIDEANRAMSEKCRENEELASKAAELHNFEEKQEQIQAKLNELLAKAHAKSDQIVSEARQEGERIIAGANGVAAATYAACNNLKERVESLRESVSKLDALLASPVADFEVHLAAVKQAALREETPSQLMERFMAQNLNDAQ